MEISPISGTRVQPVLKVPPANQDLTAIFDIANSSGTGDETYSGNQKSSGGQDSDDLDDTLTDEDAGSPSISDSADLNGSAQVSLFA